MKKVLCSLFVAAGIISNAQVNLNQRCGSGTLPQQFETWVQSLPPLTTGGGKNGGQSVQSVFNIPVVVHVIHNNEPINTISATTGGNLNAAQIQDQINILNKDFNGLNPDTANIPAVFKPYLGKFQFNFCLAVVNPTGGVMAEPGIDRINRSTKGWSAPPYTTTYIDNTIKPNSIWDPNRYMNMWVCNISGGILGYATFPNPGTSGLSGIPAPYGSATTDGLVMLNKAFGSIGTAVTNAPYHKGRTAVHEIGHWLGLRHIWGDGNCANDFCNDTPPAQTSNFGCPTHPYKLGTCAGNTTGEMTMNFMDYTDDLCMYMFSKDQKNRAQLIMTNSPMRLTLLSSTVCNLPTIGNDVGITFVSSPTYSQVINCNNFINPVVRLNNYGSTTVSSAQFTFNVDGVNTQTYSWSGSVAPSGSVNVSLPQISNLTNGAHVFTVGVFSPNGSSDMNSSNNGNTQNFTIANSFTLSATANPTAVCAGSSATLTATGGAASYTWNPGNLIGSSVVVTPTTATTYTLAGSSGTCINTRTVAVASSPSLNITVNTPTVCAGNTATITASGATTYTWSTGSNSSSISVSPAATTVYTVAGSQGTCLGAKTATVIVNPNPTVTVNSSTICSGNTATLTAAGATGYSWNTGASTAVINVSPAATTVYTVTGTSSGCTDVKTATVTVNATPTVAVNSSTICSGNSANLTASGATTYSWNTGATTAGIAVSPVATTVYTVTGTSGSCSNTKTSTVTVNTTPTVAVNTATICSGNSATLTASGAATYSWNTGATTNAISASPASTTVYTVTGANGACVDAKTTTITVNATPTVAVNSSTICSGTSANLTASGATTYSWNTGATTAGIAVSPVATTVYTVTGTSGSCSNTKTSTVTVNTTPTVAVNTATICSGNTATLTASGAATYSWNTGATTNAISASPASTTVYTVTGANGTCVNAKTTTITVNATPTVAVNSLTICSGNSANLTASGATTYSWNTGATTAGIAVSPVATTVYTVTGTSGSCSNTKTSTVTVNTTPTVNVNSYTICPGGSATLTASGAATYLWNTGSTSNPLVVSPASTTVYTVTGTTSGCSSSKVSTVTIGSSLSIVTSPANQTQCAGSSATIAATGAGTYTWNTGATGSSIVVSPTTTTTYFVVGTSGSCTGSNTAMVSISPAAVMNMATANVSCNGSANGSATITASGGAAPYAYSYSNGATTQVATSLAPGNYTATVTTSIGCVSIQTFVITQPSPIGLNATPVNPACFGACNGSVTYTANGGTPAYTYTFLPGGISSNLCAGNYTVIATDANGCTSTSAVSLIQPAAMNASVNSTNATCSGCADGSATVTATGGTAPFTYSWSPIGGNGPVANNLTPGCYTVVVADQLGCTFTNTTCVSFATGVIANAGIGNFIFYPNPTTGNLTIEFSSAAERTIEITDIAGRIIMLQKAITANVQLNMSEYSNAVYYVKVKDNNGSKQFKVIKQ